MRAWLLVILALVLATPACATAGRNFDDTRIVEIQDGATTKADVEALFGRPGTQSTLSGMPNGAVLRYIYTYAKASWGGLSAHGKSLVVDFDANGVVLEHAFSRQ